MKLGIVVVYLFDANTEYLLDLHINHIRKFTTSPYTIYGSAARLDPKWHYKLSNYPEIELSHIPPTDLRGRDEHAYYLEHLTAIAFQKGATHVVTLHLDSFPVCMGWEKTLSALTDQTGTCVAAERIFTACLFFSKDFYERYLPTFKCTKPEYLEFAKKHHFFDHSGTPYLYTCHLNGLPCHLLKNVSEKPITHFGTLCGGLVFHFSGAIRLSPGRGLGEEKPPGTIRSISLIAIQILRRIAFLRRIWSWICSHLPKRLSLPLKTWLVDQATSGEVAEKELFRSRLRNESKSSLFEVKSIGVKYEQWGGISMHSAKTVLIVAPRNSAHLLCELPQLFKKGGFRVTLLAFPHWSLTHSSYVDEFIEAHEDLDEVIEQAALLIRERSFDLKILAPDALIWALVDSKIDPLLKAKLYPIGNLSYLSALDGKVGISAIWKDLNILSPPSRAAHSLPEAIDLAINLGFPVFLKESRSGGGRGVFKCSTAEEIASAPIPVNKPFLVEKYIEGDLIGVEALFLDSRLAGYAYSVVNYSDGPYGPSLERTFMPCSEVELGLQTLAENLQITGFTNITYIRELGSQKHYLVELDFRPNRWVRQGELVGVDWSRALRDRSTPLQKPQSTKTIRQFPADLRDAIRRKQIDRIFYWLFNRNQSWKTIPFHDPGFLFRGICYGLRVYLRKIFRR